MATPAVSQLHWKKSAACSTPMRLPFWLLTPDFHIPQGYQGRSPCLVSGERGFGCSRDGGTLTQVDGVDIMRCKRTCRGHFVLTKFAAAAAHRFPATATF